MIHRPRTTLAALTLVVVPSAALADHAGPGGGASSAGPIHTVTAGTIAQGHWAAGLRFSLTRPDQLSDAELQRRSAAGIDAHDTRYGLLASVGLAYGLTDDLMISAELPFVRRDRIREGDAGAGAVDQRGTSEGVGDLSLLLKYRLGHGAHWGFAAIAGLKAPTGATHRRDLTGDRFETEHQPGTGSWDPIGGLAFSVGRGANAIDASLLYQRGTRGAQATRLGDRAEAGLAFSHRFGPVEADEDHDHGHDAEGGGHDHRHHHHAVLDGIIELNAEWECRQTVAGAIDAFSGGRSVWLSPGLRYAAASGWSLSGSIGLPIYQRIRASHPDNAYRASISLGRSF